MKLQVNSECMAIKAFFGLVACLVHGAVSAADITPLGDLPNGTFYSVANGISSDGSVVVGYSFSASSLHGREAFRWTRETGMVGLGDFPGGNLNSIAMATSADGSYVVGWGETGFGVVEAFRWSADDGMVGLGDLPGGKDYSAAEDVSADGSIVVGWGTKSDFLNSEAVYWTADTGMQPLRPYFGLRGSANAVSDDGSIIVGGGIFGSNSRAFSFKDGIFSVLGNLDGGEIWSQAINISGDGKVIVGRGSSAAGLEAFRWTSDEGMIALGDLAGGHVNSIAWDVSANGSVVVGMGQTEAGDEAFIWTEAAGLRRLADVLIAKGGDVTGWELNNARGISADGLWVVGDGINPDGNREAFLINLETSIAIDIRPFSRPNRIVPLRNGIIPVAILSTNTAAGDAIDFDATQVDIGSLEFGPEGAAAFHQFGWVRDFDRDGDADLLVFFRTHEAGISCGQTEATLRGMTYSGDNVTGRDEIRTVGCRR